MEIKHFLPEFYAFEKNERHEELKNDLMPLIEDQKLESHWDLSKCKTSFAFGDNRFIEHPILENMIWSCMDNLLDHPLVANSMDTFKFSSSFFDIIWVNSYEEGGYQEIHNHFGYTKMYNGKPHHNSFSFIYLLHNESETGTVFRSRNISNNFLTNSTSKAYEYVDEGTLIMFPYYMDHYVLPATGKRITIAGNILSTKE